MKIIESTVRKLNISQIENLDPISVYLEDFGPGRGKITITCFDESWTNYWGAMGDGYDITRFFIKASEDYLANKLKTGLHWTITDTDAIEDRLKKEIIKDRRERSLTKVEARELWDENHWFDAVEQDTDLLYKVLGDCWWERLPQKPNPEYEYLCRIIRNIKQALAQEVAV